jgi:hypothetical protein
MFHRALSGALLRCGSWLGRGVYADLCETVEEVELLGKMGSCLPEALSDKKAFSGKFVCEWIPPFTGGWRQVALGKATACVRALSRRDELASQLSSDTFDP